jgi:hypothetical protein
MECEFRKIEPNSVKSIQIPGLYVEYIGYLSPSSKREKIEYPSRIEEIDEENKTQKMYSTQSISQTDRKTISYSNPIYPSLVISQIIFGLLEYQSKPGRLGYILTG